MFHDTADYAETCPREISKASDLWRFPVRNALGSVSNNRNFNQLHIEMHQMLPAIASPKFSQTWQFRLFLHCDLRRKKTRNEVIVCVCVCLCVCAFPFLAVSTMNVKSPQLFLIYQLAADRVECAFQVTFTVWISTTVAIMIGLNQT